jgi:phosphoribosylanthranilate isomerase
MTLIKVCGITSLEDAMTCVEAGVDALGFNFYERSPRFIEPSLARIITQQLPIDLLTVGVFVNEHSPAAVEKIVEQAGLKAAQLHGDEPPEFCEALNLTFVIKVIKDESEVAKYDVDAFMLDAIDANLRGGTGKLADWSLACSIRNIVPKLFLAGGLSPENVGQAIASVEPYAVDACSSLETAPGKKDRRRIQDFVCAVRAVKR